MKFLFAPAKGKDDKQRFYWDNILKVETGDIIFNHSEGIKGVSLATSDGYDSINDDPASPWASKGFRIDLELTPLSPAISRLELVNNKDKINKYLYPITNKPFNSVGTVNQGYLYEFTPEAGKFIRDIYGKPFGNKIIDVFFHKIILTDLPINTETIVKFYYKAFHQKTIEAGLVFNEKIVARFVASLCTKPFVICSGLSGSGKTKLAQTFAMWICEKENQYCLVPVGADWTNREPLLGFPNALKSGEYVKPDTKVLDLIIKASNDTNNPYFLILDEMNLSHVERYFADFLSVMESHEKISLHAGNDNWIDVPFEIELPKNLFIIGTVNIDETTYMFSPKVLDRANVIEFRVTAEEMKNYLNNNKQLNIEALKAKGAHMAKGFVEIANDKTIKLENSDELNNELLSFFDELKKTGAEFGYRSASEILRLAGIIKKIDPAWLLPQIIDVVVMQKLLPKVHGSRRKLEPVLKTLGLLCLNAGQSMDDFTAPKTKIDFKDNPQIKYPISLEKILRMYKSLISNGFTSYAEA